MWQKRFYSRQLSEKNRVKAGGWLAALLALVFTFGTGARAFAYLPQVPPLPDPIADQPAATLLLPFFAVDLVHPTGVDTLFSIVNASPVPQLAHVILNSDLSVHVLDFDVYLTGYGLYRVDLRTLLTTGVLPPSGPFVSHVGPIPGQGNTTNLIASSCSGILPLPPVPSTQLTGVQEALTGVASSEFSGLCTGLTYGDGIARGYITIDDVSECMVEPPDAPGQEGYLGTPGTTGNLPRIITDNNVLWGDSFYINFAANKSYAQNLVHIAANPAFTPGQYTFYGRYDYASFPATPGVTTAWQAYDHREPLPTTFLSRYITPASSEGTRFNSGTTEVVWRDSKVDNDQTGFSCPASAGNPPWYGLSEDGLAIFDEQEDVETPPACHFSPCPPVSIPGFPAETQRIGVGGAAPTGTAGFPSYIPTTFDSGFLWMDLNFTTNTSLRQSPGLTNPAEASAWAWSTYANTSATAGVSSYIVSERANQLDTGNTPNTCTPTGSAGCPVP
jgi:hypothetical protein